MERNRGASLRWVLMDPWRLVRLSLQAIAAVLGGFGVFCLWYSWLSPAIALHAIFDFGLAVVITLFLGKE